MSFMYINPGYHTLFDTYDDGTDLKDTSLFPDNGGICFRAKENAGDSSYTVSLPGGKEYWARFDIVRENNNNSNVSSDFSTYIDFRNANGNSFGLMMSGYKDAIVIQKNHSKISGIADFSFGKLSPRRFTVHVISSATEGKIELYCNQALIASWSGDTSGDDLNMFRIITSHFTSSWIYAREDFSNIIVSDAEIKPIWRIEEIPCEVIPGDWTAVADKAGYYQATAAEKTLTIKPTADEKAKYASGEKKLIGIQTVCFPGYTESADITSLQFKDGDVDAGTKKLGGTDSSSCVSNYVQVTDIEKANVTITTKRE